MVRYMNQPWTSGNNRNRNKSVAQGWGAAFVATAYAVAMCEDVNECATQTNIARLAGMSNSAVSSKLSRLAGAVVEVTQGCNDDRCRRQIHYRSIIR